MVKLEKLINELKPAMMMVVVQVVYSGNNVLYKLAAADGMSLWVLVAYRYIFATAFMLPLAYVLERKTRPKLTWTVLFQAFLCGLLGGSSYQILYLESLVLTSATFATAMTNLIPAVTFVLAVLFRLEELGPRTSAGKAKIGGTIMGIGGAMAFTFVKGVPIEFWSTHLDLLSHYSHKGIRKASSQGSGLILGLILAIISCFTNASWLIIQAKMSAKYPCPYSSTALMSATAAIQAIVFSLCVERDWSQWKLGWNIRLLTTAYSGIIVSGFMITLIIICVRLRGPVYTAIFNPLMLILVALAGSLLLDEKLHLGSIIGAIFIIFGLYAVLWGKSKEREKLTQLVPAKGTEEMEKMEIIIASPPTTCKGESSSSSISNNSNNNNSNKELEP